MTPNNEIIIYQSEDKKIEVSVKEETVWLSLNRIAELFDVQKAAISKHIKKIYTSGELKRESTVSILETVQMEGQRRIKRNITYYNLDVIISVGYRVNSKKATQFRIWATQVLKNYLNALTALCYLVAASQPQQKKLMINLVTQMINIRNW